jgi:hypothetical protein
MGRGFSQSGNPALFFVVLAKLIGTARWDITLQRGDVIFTRPPGTTQAMKRTVNLEAL